MGRLISEEAPFLIAFGVFFAVLSAADALSAKAAVTAFLVSGALILLRRARNARPSDARPLQEPVAGNGTNMPDAVAIIRRMPDPLLLLDNAGQVTFYNDAAHVLLGRGAQGRHISSALRAPAVLQAVRKTIESGEGTTVEYIERVPVERHFDTHIVPVEYGKEDQRAVILHLHDITAMRRAEQMRADFVANASHELRTPLSSLSGFIETLRGPAKGDLAATDRFLNIMQEQAARMARLINDLLSLSRIELNEHVPPGGQISLEDVLNGVMESMGPLAAQFGVTLKLHAPADLPKVKGEHDELTQVFQNLVDNAIKYGASGKLIDLELGTTRTEGLDMVFARVRDYGEGIAPEHLPRLTERFYRINVTQSRESGGTGLGLAIVKHILNRHMGHLGIESTPGKGSSFTAYIPALTR